MPAVLDSMPRESEPPLRRAAVIGLGERGMAAARALTRSRVHVIGVDLSIETERGALREGLISSIGWDGSDLSICQLVVLAGPTCDLGEAAARAVLLSKPGTPVVAITAADDPDARLAIASTPSLIVAQRDVGHPWTLIRGALATAAALEASEALVHMLGGMRHLGDDAIDVAPQPLTAPPSTPTRRAGRTTRIHRPAFEQRGDKRQALRADELRKVLQ